MTREEYEIAVMLVLDAYTTRAADQLRRLLARLPEKATRVVIDIFVDQGAEGFLDVQVSVEGLDLYNLNRQISADACLFETKMAEHGLNPPLPLMGDDEESFSVADALTDCAAGWIRSIWNQTEFRSFHLPLIVESHDGYGSLPPFKLNAPV